MPEMSIREAVLKQRECDQRVIQEQIEAEERAQSTMPDLDAIRARRDAFEYDLNFMRERKLEAWMEPLKLLYIRDVTALLAALDEKGEHDATTSR